MISTSRRLNNEILGLKIEPDMSFDSYINGLVKKCDSNLKLLWSSSKDRATYHKQILVNSLVMSHLFYCDTVYSRFLTRRQKDRLNSIQYRALRFIHGVCKEQRVSQLTLLERSRWMSLETIRESRLLQICFSVYKNLPQSAAYAELIPKREVIGMQTRNQTQLASSLNHWGSQTLNNYYCNKFIKLPNQILNVCSINSFKTSICKFLQEYEFSE